MKNELKLFNGELPNKKHPQVIERDYYMIYIVRGDDQKTINEIQNTGKIIGAPRYGVNTPNDGDDEIIFIVKK